MASTDAGAIKAAKFAANAEAKRSEKEIEFISVVKAERQSVAASTNYRLCVKVSDSGAEGQDAADVFVKVIVNVDAKGSHKLLSYEASDCGEEEEEG
jgi:Aspartic acid proteinase inhibitor